MGSISSKQGEPPISLDRAKPLGAVLRAVRNHRHMGQLQVARALDISRRRYLDMEAGAVACTVQNLFDFARATDCDLMALIAATSVEDPSLAVRCADNKLMIAMMGTVIDFNEAMGERAGDLRSFELMRAADTVFGKLAQDLAERRIGEDWLRRLIARFFGLDQD